MSDVLASPEGCADADAFPGAAFLTGVGSGLWHAVAAIGPMIVTAALRKFAADLDSAGQPEAAALAREAANVPGATL